MKLLVLLFIARAAFGQSAANSGEIVGDVFDASSGAVQGATVTLRNRSTNFSRVAATDRAGRYAVPDLPLGVYDVQVDANGFERALQEVTVTLGSSTATEFRLAVAAKSDWVIVTAQESAPRSILTELQIRELPSNGRRLQNNVLETPATLIEPECRGFSVSGQKGIYANVSIDGGDYNSTWGCGIRGRSESAPNFSLEAIGELQVVRNTFSAEFGRSTGGEINLSTKSGGNQFHGSAFDLARNGALSQNDAFGRPSVSGIQQFGGSLSGAIVKDKTFFFVAPEFQFGSKPVQLLYSVLDVQNLRNTPGAQALLAVAPEGEIHAISNSQSSINRIDHRLSNANTLFARFDFTRTIQINSPGSSALSTGLGVAPVTGSATNIALTSQFVLPDTNYTGVTQLTSALSNSRVNELRFQFSRELRPRTTEGDGPQVTIQNAGATVAQYGPPAALSSFGSLTYASTDNRYQLADNFSIVTGAHTTKIGFDYTHIAGNLLFNGGDNGLYTFPSLAAFLARMPSQYQQFTGTGALDLKLDELAFFIQHDWRMRPGLTLNAGLRYDAELNPGYLNPTAPAKRYPYATSIPDDMKMFGPRAGITWDVGNGGRTVVRAGGGLFYAPTFLSLFAQSILFNGGNPDRAFTVNVNNPALYPAGLPSAPLNNLPVFDPVAAAQTLPANSNNVIYMDPHFRNPKAAQFQGGVEQTIARGVTAATSFSYINTVHIARQRDTNLGAPVVDATGRDIFSNPRPLSQFGVGQATESSARALYRGLTTSLSVRRRGYTLDAYYTLSWNFSDDDSERGISSIRYDDVLNLKKEYSYSNIDERHQFLFDGVFNLPFGFDISGTSRLTSGRPFTAVAGTDLNKDLQNTDRPIINGLVVSRNTFRNSGFKDVSLRVQRNFAMPRDRGVLALSAEFFNAFNFANLQISATNMVYGSPTFDQLHLPTNTAGDAFQAQLGLRYRF